jgi:hypothetical protein
VRCLPNGNCEAAVTGRVRNISLGGVGLVVTSHVDPGTSLVVEVARTASGKAATMTVRVVHVRAMPIRGWFLGCVFPQPLAEADVKALV